MADEDTRLMSLIAESQKADGNKIPYPEADVYGFSISYLYEISVANKESTFVTKKTETRKHSKGTWKQYGKTETVTKTGTNEVFGTKTVFQFIHEGGTASSWFVTEYCLDKGFRTRHKLPIKPEQVVCKLEFVSQRLGEGSSSKP